MGIFFAVLFHFTLIDLQFKGKGVKSTTHGHASAFARLFSNTGN